MKCSNEHEMVNMGQWPGPDMKGMVNKWYCKQCNEYKSEELPQFDLVDKGDGTFQQVLKANA